METYNIYYVHENRQGTMRSHCLTESIEYLLDHGCEILAIRDVSTGELFKCAHEVRRIEDE